MITQEDDEFEDNSYDDAGEDNTGEREEQETQEEGTGEGEEQGEETQGEGTGEGEEQREETQEEGTGEGKEQGEEEVREKALRASSRRADPFAAFRPVNEYDADIITNAVVNINSELAWRAGLQHTGELRTLHDEGYGIFSLEIETKKGTLFRRNAPVEIVLRDGELRETVIRRRSDGRGWSVGEGYLDASSPEEIVEMLRERVLSPQNVAEARSAAAVRYMEAHPDTFGDMKLIPVVMTSDGQKVALVTERRDLLDDSGQFTGEKTDFWVPDASDEDAVVEREALENSLDSITVIYGHDAIASYLSSVTEVVEHSYSVDRRAAADGMRAWEGVPKPEFGLLAVSRTVRRGEVSYAARPYEAVANPEGYNCFMAYRDEALKAESEFLAKVMESVEFGEEQTLPNPFDLRFRDQETAEIGYTSIISRTGGIPTGSSDVTLRVDGTPYVGPAATMGYSREGMAEPLRFREEESGRIMRRAGRNLRTAVMQMNERVAVRDVLRTARALITAGIAASVKEETEQKSRGRSRSRKNDRQ